MKRIYQILFLWVFIMSCGTQFSKGDEVPLIPRDILFGNPLKASPRISPDGKKISYLAPVNNVLNIWVGNIDDAGNISNEYVLTKDTNRGIRSYFWAPNGKQILYIQDTNGDENWRLYGADLETKEIKLYTPFDNVQVQINSVDKKFPNDILILMNKENPKHHDLYKLNLQSGDLELIEKNPGTFTEFIDDHNLQPKATVSMLKNSSSQLMIKENGKWKPIITWQPEDAQTSGPLAFAKDTDYLYLNESQGVNASRLVKLNIKTLKKEVLAEDPNYDLSNVLIDPDTYEILAVTFLKDKQEWLLFDPEFKQTFEQISKLDEGEIHILNMDYAKQKYIIGFEKDNGPAAFYYFDKKTGIGKFLFVNKPDLKKYKLAHMEPISFTAKDGLEIHGYLTFPINKKSNLPLILDVHGGPAARDVWGYNSDAQWFANRGYAVLNINYRGSTGYGKKFLNAGDREWSGKMHQDLIDAVNWAVEKGIADPNKIAIYGGSYGGYAALVGATFTPDIFCCAVDIVGPSNLITLLESIPPYWDNFRAQLYKKVGNPETEPEFLKSCSPLFKADQIKIPILVAQGANDPRVKQAEAEQIVQAMKDKNIDYEYLLFPDEGHGFAKPENRIKFYKAAEKFLAKNLGGRYEK
ncbi:S9 family peptidase [Candidatus Dependentiae bacterium]|nr:S9 family peptidase [Candidatus Dependentiae bacterium]